jgi:hypothetical protein
MRWNRTGWVIGWVVLGCGGAVETQDEATSSVCHAFCEARSACAPDPDGEAAECSSWCEAQPIEPRCQEQWQSFTDCVPREMTCSVDGNRVGCEKPGFAYDACVSFSWSTTKCEELCSAATAVCTDVALAECLAECYAGAAQCFERDTFSFSLPGCDWAPPDLVEGCPI